jgi:hypothetical protein
VLTAAINTYFRLTVIKSIRIYFYGFFCSHTCMVFVICVNIFLTNHRGAEDAEEERWRGCFLVTRKHQYYNANLFSYINTKIPIYLLIDFFRVTVIAKKRKFLLLSKQVLRGCKEDKKQPPKNKGKYSEY